MGTAAAALGGRPKVRVMVVDDSAIVRGLLVKHLHHRGAEAEAHHRAGGDLMELSAALREVDEIRRGLDEAFDALMDAADADRLLAAG